MTRLMTLMSELFKILSFIKEAHPRIVEKTENIENTIDRPSECELASFLTQ